MKGSCDNCSYVSRRIRCAGRLRLSPCIGRFQLIVTVILRGRCLGHIQIVVDALDADETETYTDANVEYAAETE